MDEPPALGFVVSKYEYHHNTQSEILSSHRLMHTVKPAAAGSK